MRYLLDTCLISELIRPRPDAGVLDWLAGQQESRLYLSVLTFGDLRKGIARLPDGSKRIRLTCWLDNEMRTRFAARLLPIDEEVAERWGMVSAEAAAKGIAVPVIDGLIAATAWVHGLTVVTRNTRDVIATGVPVCNPWTQTESA